MSHSEDLLTLRKFVSPLYAFSSEEEWEHFAGTWKPFTAKRKTLLLATGETEKHLYFVTEGVQRAFSLSGEEKDVTLVFTYAPSFSGVVDSFLLQQPSKYYMETLTASRFIRTTYSQVDEMMKLYPSFQSFIIKALSATLSGVLERQIELQCFSAEQKFLTLLKRSPHVLRLIPHKYLASYLGIDATTFSKLLGSVRLTM
ncbi:Crp/Fnr family transcriptional regulator [Danxiaibacter flavus]|uniref:Crp/Fnr family transcriptional regulator n=1 Tax=Danxiaibacter flavus TaxID=3049108 RepID=A0ABV3ZDT2_9BACT|nr:Crp/Fnr family transcriptional regulator [Chitinophagaceae bacterium DXS]